MKQFSFRKYLALALVAIAIIGWGVLKIREYFLPATQIKIGGQILTVEVAQNPRAWQRGLSGRQSLASDRGMLFIHPSANRQAYWMLGMKFPLDIIWLDNGVVVDIAPNVPPAAAGDQSPAIYLPRLPARAVLEVNAGFCEKYGVKIGDKIEILSR